MRRVLFTLLFLLPIFLSAGTRDSLLTLISNSKEDSLKVLLLNELAYLQIDTSFSAAKKNIEKGKNLAQKLNYSTGLGISLYNEGRNLAFNNDYKEAIRIINSSIVHFEKTAYNQDKVVRANILLGWVNYNLSNYLKALTNFNHAHELAIDCNYEKGLPSIYINIGRIHNMLGDTDNALHYYKKAKIIYEANDDKDGLAYYYTNIAYVLYQNENYSEALKMYKNGLDLSKKLNNKRLESNILYKKLRSFSNSTNYKKQRSL